jgi:hypothetical protein
MLLTAGDVISFVRDAVKWTSAEEPRFYGPLSMAYWDLCELTDWIHLRKEKAVSFSGSAIVTPGDTIGVTAIIGSDGEAYWQAEKSALAANQGRKRWHYSGLADSATLAASPSVNIVSAEGVPATDAVTMFYWVYPPKITSAGDAILIPSSRALVIKTIQYIQSVIEHDAQAAEQLRTEYEAAVVELLSKHQAPNRFKGGRR